MVMKYLSKKLIILLLSVSILSSCKPSELNIEIYSSDMQSVSAGEIVDVQVKTNFKLMGSDEKGLMPKIMEVVKKYLPKDSEINQTEGGFGKVLSIVTTIPMGKENKLNKYLKQNPIPIFLLVENNKIVLKRNEISLKAMNLELTDINMMMSLDFPASSTLFRITNDQKQPLTVSAIAVFSEKKAFLIYEKEIKRRKNIELVFEGGSGSVYKQLSPQLEIKF